MKKDKAMKKVVLIVAFLVGMIGLLCVHDVTIRTRIGNSFKYFFCIVNNFGDKRG